MGSESGGRGTPPHAIAPRKASSMATPDSSSLGGNTSAIVLSDILQTERERGRASQGLRPEGAGRRQERGAGRGRRGRGRRGGGSSFVSCLKFHLVFLELHNYLNRVYNRQLWIGAKQS